MRLRANGGQGTHGMLRQFYIDNKKFIAPNGKGFTLSTWIKAVQEGKTVPKSSEALQILTEINEKCTREQLTALEAGLD
eukprot:3502985-Karenia_brevis.AAC.1